MTTADQILEPARDVAGSEIRPYPPSWINLFIGWIERLPGPAWSAYLGLIALSVAITQFVVWWAGIVPAGQLAVSQAYYGFVLPATVWLIHHLDRVARSALDSFRPALDVPADAFMRWQYGLTVVPRRPAAVLLVAAVALSLSSYAADPVGTQVIGYSPVALAIRAVYESAISWVVLVLLYHTIRQLRLVSRIHASAPRVDLFQPGPLYAFSRLTSQTAIGLILLQAPSILFISWTELTTIFGFVWIGLIAIIATAAFVLPLQGMHRRIYGEKERLAAEVGRRIETTIGVVHNSVDGRDFSQADNLNNALSALIAERDLVKRLPTWPWELGTLGAVVSAVLLPIGLWLVTRFLERVV